MRTSGVLDITATALEPIHHGAGTSGNTQVIRRQDIIVPGNPPRQARVPYVTGNSLAHMIRHHGVAYALDVMAVEDGQLSKPVVNLLFAGGSLGKGNGVADLATARRLAGLLPILDVMGYSAGSEMWSSRLRVHHLHLMCEENAWRAPARLRQDPAFAPKAGAYVTAREFHTRHEVTRDPLAFRMLTAPDALATVEKKSRAVQVAHADKGDSLQMIYDFELVKPGSRWWTAIEFSDLTDLEVTALTAALTRWSQGIHEDPSDMYRGRIDEKGHIVDDAKRHSYLYYVGAKSARGFGLMSWQFSGAIRVSAPEFVASDVALPARRDSDTLKERLESYNTHLREHKTEILEALEAIAT